MPVQRGSCHCGAVRIEVRGAPAEVEVCNCSICRRSGYLHWSVEPEAFRLLTPMDAIRTYRFGTRTAQHHFCRTCGISAFRVSRSEPHLVTVNARCLEGLDVEALPRRHFDGVDWEAEMQRQGR